MSVCSAPVAPPVVLVIGGIPTATWGLQFSCKPIGGSLTPGMSIEMKGLKKYVQFHIKFI